MGSGRLRSMRLAVLILSTLGVAMALAPSAGAQSIVNTSSTGGQTNWLETFATGGATDQGANIARISVLVKHAPARRVTGLKIDANYDGTDNTSTVATTSVSAQRPNVSGGYDYSRVTQQVTLPTSGSGLSCGFLSGTRKAVKPLRIRAVLDDGTLTPSTTSDIKFTATSNCTGPDDPPFLYNRSQSASSINVGGSVDFTYTGDDPDSGLGSNITFNGIRWRMRRLSDGVTTAAQTSCPNNGDNAVKALDDVTFPRRGRWIVEAELLTDGGCTSNSNSGYWWYIGGVDVNSPQSASPTIDLSATRPVKNGNTTITASVADPSDDDEGGVAEALEWDLNENTGDGVNGFEDADVGDTFTGLSPAQRTRTINTAGLSPGLHTVRARVGDNGALGGADNIRRTKIDTTTFLVDSDPQVSDLDLATETETDLPIDLGGTDADGDTLTYSITGQPQHGTLSGAGANRTYTPDPGYAGTDSFSFSVADGFGGTDSATVNIRIDPNTTVDSGPTGTIATRAADLTFSSAATGATFECSLDGSPYAACTTPASFTDLGEGLHTFRVRAVAAGNTDQTPASQSWTVDAFPNLSIDSEPAAETSETSATFAFSVSEDGATVAPRTDCKLDGGDYRPCSSPITYNDLDDGQHMFSLRATDAFDKQTLVTRTWTIDAVGSNTLIDPTPPARTASTSVTIDFNSPDAAATFECASDGAAFSSCTSPVTLSNLSQGPHRFRVRAIDGAGIVDPTPATASFVVDLTAPTSSITAGPGPLTRDETPTFEFSADEPGASFECDVDGGGFTSCGSPFTTDPLADGPHTFKVRATDSVGNVEATPVSRAFTLDRAAPDTVINSGPADGSSVAAQSATFGFSSPDGDAVAFRCRLDAADWKPCDSNSSQTYAGLEDGEHTFAVRAVDGAGNADATPASRTWRVDTRAPQTSIEDGPSGTVRRSNATFKLAADDLDASFECALDDDPFTPCDATPRYTDLADGDHRFRARAVDALGNADASPAVRRWSVDTKPEEPPKGQTKPNRRCFLNRVLPRCGKPFVRAHAAAAGPKTNSQGTGFGRIKLKANGGGAPLASVKFKLANGLRAHVVGSGENLPVGSIELFGFSKKRTYELAGDGGPGAKNLASGAPSVKLSKSGASVVVEGLPAKVRKVKVVLGGSPNLEVATTQCGTQRWKAVLRDIRDNVASLKTRSDVRCPKGASG